MKPGELQFEFFFLFIKKNKLQSVLVCAIRNWGNTIKERKKITWVKKPTNTVTPIDFFIIFLFIVYFMLDGEELCITIFLGDEGIFWEDEREEMLYKLLLMEKFYK